MLSCCCNRICNRVQVLGIIGALDPHTHKLNQASLSGEGKLEKEGVRPLRHGGGGAGGAGGGAGGGGVGGGVAGDSNDGGMGELPGLLSLVPPALPSSGISRAASRPRVLHSSPLPSFHSCPRPSPPGPPSYHPYLAPRPAPPRPFPPRRAPR